MITHCFHAIGVEGNAGIGYEVIICHDLMAQLWLVANFKRKVLDWDIPVVTTKELGNLPGKTNPANHDMQEVVMHNSELVFTMESTDRVVDITESTYKRDDLDKVASSATQLNTKERKLLIGLLN